MDDITEILADDAIVENAQTHAELIQKLLED